jgi:outer membrane immunogenic protein
MKKLALAISMIAIGATGASAADMAVKARPVAAPVAYSWTGCYVGGFVGGAWADRDARAVDTNGYNGLGDTWFYKTDSSFIGGGTLGCNYQTGAFVFGLEGEAGYLRSTGSALDPLSPFLPLDTRASTRLGDWYGLVAGRAGFAVNRTLFYVKGGVAFVDTNVSTIDAILQPVVGNTITATGSDARATWALGGGVEYALTNNWTVKGEYMYLDTRQTLNACGLTTLGATRFCWAHDVPGLHTAKLGLNYKFNWGAPLVAKY